MVVTEVCLFREKRKKRNKHIDLHLRIGGEDQVQWASFTCYCPFLRGISLHTFAQKKLQKITHLILPLANYNPRWLDVERPRKKT